MKPIYSILIAISFLILSSCTFLNSYDNLNLKRQEILGSWTLSKESLKKIKKEKQKDKIIAYFQLNSDSTATVSFEDSIEKKMAGTWVWKAEKKLGNNNLGISLKSDVVIYVNGLFTLGLQLNEIDGKINLTAADYLFEKQR